MWREREREFHFFIEIVLLMINGFIEQCLLWIQDLRKRAHAETGQRYDFPIVIITTIIVVLSLCSHQYCKIV